MKIPKSLLIALLLSIGLTGCYTQLEYTRKAKPVTDEKPVKGYSWDNEPEERANLTKADSIYIAETYGAKVAPYREEEESNYEDEEYIPIDYKDYDVIERYEACGCDPYKTYVIYDSYYPASSSYYGTGYHHDRWSHGYHGYADWWFPYHGYVSPFYSWRWRHHFGFRYYHRSFGFASYWGSPYYYYDPFFYDPFYYGYASPIFYNNYYFYDGYAGNVRSVKSNRRYGRRSIGTDRVAGNRNSSTVRTRSGVTRSKANTATVRSRTTGVEKSRGTTVQRTRSTTTRTRSTGRVGSSGRTRSDSGTQSRGTVKRTRSGDNGSSIRSRGNSSVKRDRGNDKAVISRTGLRTRGDNVIPARTDRSQIESRIRQQRVKRINDKQQRSRSSFLGRFNSILKTGRSIENNRPRSRGTSPTFKIPSSTRSKFGTSRSRSSSRTKVTPSRSRSSKSSSLRSRSSSSRSSSSKRSRGNN